MIKLKKKSDGNVYDCSILLDGRDMAAVYWDGISWTVEALSNFVPAAPAIDY